MPRLAKNSKPLSETTTQDLNALMDEVLTRACAKGATDVMVSVHQDQGFSVDVRMREVETVAFNEDKGIQVVVYKGHQKGSASSTDVSSETLDDLIHAALDIASVSTKDPCFGLADKALMTTSYPDLNLCHPWSITPVEAIKLAQDCETQALTKDARIQNSDGVSVSSHVFLTGFANTFGGRGLVRSSNHHISCALIAKEKENMQRDYALTTARFHEGLDPIDVLAERAATRTLSRLGAKKIKTQKTPVIFSSRVSSGLFSSFIQAISGSNLYRKNSFLLDALGTAVFPAWMHIQEHPHLLKALGSAPFDPEGVPTRDNVFVEEGILKSYVLGSYSARRMGLKTTANAGGVHNLTISPNAGTLDELLRQMGTGLLVNELMGQGVNGLTGDYSRGATGFWVEGGVIQHPVEEITIAGNLKDMFHTIVAIGQDINPNIGTRCGSVLVDNMMVAGS